MNYWKTPIQKQITAWLSRRTARSGVRRVGPLSAAIASEIGAVRTENQDRAILVQGWDGDGRRFAVAAVADGIGGMRDGGACAALALGAFVAAIHDIARSGPLDSEEWLSRAIFAANEAVHYQFRGTGGSTLVAALIRSRMPSFWGSAGDSRVYQTYNGKLLQLSVDDTIAGQLGKKDDESGEQSKLLQYVGMGSDLEPHIKKVLSDGDDQLILTTDGIHYLSKNSNWFDRVILNSPDPGSCAKRLIDIAMWCGGPDNASITIIPTAHDFGDDIEPLYDCLEIWDSHGDLQLIGKNEQDIVTPSISPIPEVATPTPTNKKRNTPNKARASRQVIREEDNKQQTNIEEKKASPKRTPRKKQKNEVPQLLMEFPNKSN
ncbi:PP2C family protein-serine/threonine phosphatase [Pseudomonas zeae]|uniref:Protein phosphatase 2C domain-containing protein n=1 Tax=Pseudomonas zeae TaxID=2745510 RepID=A0ABU5BNH1_9PSED|nr:protein phosphatase 2C domain-containing protein [Pseudomonas zeae]MDX9678238.1 protein phosphatase 2C domain-containing protein [Pseudomonas zeae]